MKVAFVNNIPSLYRRYLFDELSKLYEVDDFSVYYLSQCESVRDWGEIKLVDYEKVFDVIYQRRNPLTTTSDYIINSGFLSELSEKDTVVYFGYNYLTYIFSALYRRMQGKKNVLFCESTLSDNTVIAIKTRIKSLLVKGLFSNYIVPGKASKLYLQSLGVKSSNIDYAYNSSELKPDHIRFSNSGTPIRLLYVGRLSEEKNLEFVCEQLVDSDLDFILTIVGSGPQEQVLRELVCNDGRFRIIGHCNSDELHSVYKQNDMLVLASKSEPWGLVVNEAINFGLAVLVSSNVGCRYELVDGNGAIFDLELENDFLNKLKLIVSNIDEYKEKSYLMSKKFTAKNQAEMFFSSIEGNNE
ncbi:TPA: glycosyltransferase family 4 protein [Vibrio parahaemolyticus]|nr:glycosyltransferase family 4 protein [Vibrio parahaemolyticus]HCG7365707.1 glycosyltransferase family 4 protein [Vibrio parahaemolyticus]